MSDGSIWRKFLDVSQPQAALSLNQPRRLFNKTRRTYWELLAAATGRTNFPLILVDIDVVSTCQLKCLGCPNSRFHRDLAFMSVEDFAGCLGHIDVPLIRSINLFRFSEPLLHPDLPGILLQIPKQRWKCDTVQIYTNAQHCDEAQLKEIFKTGVLKALYVSCDGDGTPEAYEKSRPPAKWDRLVHFLSKAKELRDKYAPGVSLTTETCCGDESGRERWTKLLRPLGWEPCFRNYFIMPESAENPAGYELRVPRVPCWSVYFGYLYVDYDGTVVPCCAHPRAAEYGNLKEDKYSTIFLGERRRAFMRMLRQSRSSMAICGKCEIGS